MKRLTKRFLATVLGIAMIIASTNVWSGKVYASGSFSRSEVEAELNTLKSQYPAGSKWTTSFAGGLQCYAFAHYVFNTIFNRGNAQVGNGATSSNSTCYKLNNVANDITVVGTLSPGYSDAQLEQLLESAKPGDYIQVKRNSSGVPHSMIVTYVDATANKIGIFDANAVAKNTVGQYTQTFSYFKQRNAGVSIYHYKYYNDDTSGCNCSTSYAGTYTVNTSQYPLTMRSGHGTGYSAVTTIPKGTEVTVTKGDGTWAHVEWNGHSGYCAMEYLVRKSNNPKGVVDSLNGRANSIELAGWAFDSDNLGAGLGIHVYIGEECHPIVANLERKDVNNVYGCGNNHGFAAKINTERTGRQNIRVYAINVGSGDNVLLMSKDVDITVDSEPPKITRTYVSEVTRDSYRVCAEISDDNGVKKVSVATWSQEGQTDLKWRDAKYNGAGTYYIDINRSEHSQILNNFYYNHIYVYDYANNGARASQNMDYKVTSDTGKNISDGEYRIVSAADESKAIDVCDDGTTAGTNIDIKSNLSNKNQTFDIAYVGNGFYKIIGRKSGLALDVNGDTYQLGSNVVLSQYHDGSNQQWMFKKSSNGVYSIISRSTGMALDIHKGVYADGTNVEVYNYQDSDNQHWKLKRVLHDDMVSMSDGNIYSSNYTKAVDKINVTVNGVKLKQKTDYNISYTKKGNTVTYSITGIGGYCDTVSKSVLLKEEPTTKPTETTTQKPTETTTQKPTETTTQKPTETTTQRPTETTTQRPTEPATQESTETTTQKPTEPITQEPTEPATEQPTEIKKYIVKFVDDDRIIDTQRVSEGMSAVEPEITKTGYTLYWDDDFDEVYENMIINAEWVANDYKVKFNEAGGRVYEKSMEVTYDEEYGEMPEAERSGYLFDGWYTKKSGGEEISEFTVMNTAKTHTLYAHWEKVTVPKISIRYLSSLKKGMSVAMNAGKGEDGCQIMYSTSKNFRSYKKINTSDDVENIKKLKSRTKYYVKVRGYVYDSKGKKVYGAWSKVNTIAVK